MPTATQHVTIALCTYNGAPYLTEQLTSYLDQTHENWSLWVSDDGSTDGTWDILRAFRRQHGQTHDVRLIKGPGKGACQNFLSLLCHPEFPHGYVALSDQDDVWFRDKHSRALGVIGDDRQKAVLYGAQSIHTGPDLHPIGRSRVPVTDPHFCNAIVQNIVSGHSAVLSPEALRTVRNFGAPADVPFHDWWIYQVISGTGGRVLIDDRAVLNYRQHAANVIGAPRGIRAALKRLNGLRKCAYQTWVRQNAKALWNRRGLLDPSARRILQLYFEAQPRPGLNRVRVLRALGIKRQARFGTVTLYMAGFMGWL